MTETIRVLLADDHAIVRDGIRSLLATEPGIQVVGEAADGQEAVAMAESLKPDVFVMDLVMPGMDGLEAIRRIVTQQPDARILVLTSFATDDKVFTAIKAGAVGYLLKDCDADELVQAIRQVYEGQSWLHPRIARLLVQEVASNHSAPGTAQPDAPPTVEALSARELQVLRLAAGGLSNREIAECLIVTVGTVKSHLHSIYGKLGVESRTQALVRARELGLA